jgi:RNA polymerase sigma-70 factor, ECF subfamily
VADEQLAAIYEQYRRSLLALALSITRCPARAEDAVHEAFARLCRGHQGVVGDRVAYVFSAVRNAAINQVRRAPRETESADDRKILFDLHPADPRQQVIDRERQLLVSGAVEQLSGELREVVILRIYGNLRFAHIAQIVNAPPATVATRYRRALERLKTRLERFV